MVVQAKTNFGTRMTQRFTRLMSPIAGQMAKSKILGRVAVEASRLSGNVALGVGATSWEMGASLQSAAQTQGFDSYMELVDGLSSDYVAAGILPKSWVQGTYDAAWSTSEFVKWGYFAVGLHAQVLVGLMFPKVAEEMSGSLVGFGKEFGISTVLAGVFTWGMIAGHHTFHVLEAAKTYNLEQSVQENLGAKLVEKLEDGSVKFRMDTRAFWYEMGRMLLTIPTGKHEAVIRDGLSFRINGTPALNVLAAGPRFDRWVNRFAGALFIPAFAVSAVMLGMGEAVPHIFSLLVPKGMALTTIAFLGKFQDNGALKKFAAKKAEDSRLEAEARSGVTVVDSGRDAVDASARRALADLLGRPRNFAAYGGRDERFHGVVAYAPDGAHNAGQAGRHTAHKTAAGDEINTSPDQVGQEKWIVLRPESGGFHGPSVQGYYETLRVLPDLQNEYVSQILGMEGVSGGGRENEGGASINAYGGGDEAAISILMEAAARAGAKHDYRYGDRIFLGLDNAADSIDMFDPETGLYTWQGERMSGDELVERYVELFYRTRHMLAFEDPFAAPRSQWKFWQALMERLGDKMLIIGDDNLCTNPTLAFAALQAEAVNAGLVKLNQVGSFIQAWMYMELFHSAGKNTVISHRSTQPKTLPNPLEVTAALAASFRPVGRVVLGKLGGVYLENRAALFTEMQNALEQWRTGAAVTDGKGPDGPGSRIEYAYARPSPLGAGKYGLEGVMGLSDGEEIISPIPGGLSRGEKETNLLGPEAGARVFAEMVAKLGLVGRPLGEVGNVFDIERKLMAWDIQAAQGKGQLPPKFTDGAWDQFEEAAAFKRNVGGDVTLALGQLLMKASARRDGIPPWLAYRQHGLDLNETYGFGFDRYEDARRAIYEPIFTGALLDEAKIGPVRRSSYQVPDEVQAGYIFRDPVVLSALDETHQREVEILREVFEIEGSLVYRVEIRGTEEKPELVARVIRGSKKGIAEGFHSRADGDEFVPATDNKAHTVMNGYIWVDWLNPELRGDQFAGRHIVAVPRRKGERDGEVMGLIGTFKEVSPERKMELFPLKLEMIKRIASDRPRDMTAAEAEVEIDAAFSEIPMHAFFEQSIDSIYSEYISPRLGK